ncbi:hypothetical protein FRAHR75_1670003 [Frankia sp. Hr75.2]|nr:hypothetical protein FRAHR75_1670003 [Frankia sp. Hr75.2]SQD97894.1 hypothetical protein FMEAI12_4370011 [Parafrankia sp. Ea1.12]
MTPASRDAEPDPCGRGCLGRAAGVTVNLRDSRITKALALRCRPVVHLWPGGSRRRHRRSRR